MKAGALKSYKTSKESLRKQKAALERRLAQIDEALGLREKTSLVSAAPAASSDTASALALQMKAADSIISRYRNTLRELAK